jgi:hypothetical protein
MPATRKVTARATTRGSGPVVELRFRNLRQGGHAVTFDLEVHPGTAAHMAIHASPVTTADTVVRAFYGSMPQYFRGVRVNSECPEFVFTDAGGTSVTAEVHLGTGRPEVTDGDVEHIRVR